MQWLEGIADNDAFTFANNAAIVAAVGRGEVELGLVNHYYVYQALAEDPEFAGDQPQLPRRRHRQPRDRHRRIDAARAPTARTKPIELIRFLLERGGAALLLAIRRSSTPWRRASSRPRSCRRSSSAASADIELDQLGGDLQSTREMIRDAGLEG